MTESTTPNFAIRYPTAASTGPQFATGIADMASDADTLFRTNGRLTLREVTTATTAANSDFIVVTSGNGTITLPSPTAGTTVGVVAPFAAALGAVTVNTPSGLIFGAALGSTTCKVATSGIVLYADGTNYVIVQGVQDTGWVALTPQNGWSTPGISGGTSAAYRLIGDWVNLRGTFVSGGSSGLATLPSGVRPPTKFFFPMYISTGTANYGWVDTTGVINANAVTANTAIDGWRFPLS